MGVFTRSDSKFLWVYLETAPAGVKAKQRTDFLIGHTADERKENWKLALAVYGEKMAAIGRATHDLPGASKAPSTTFRTLATWYDLHVIPQHKGKARERKMLPRLVKAFGEVTVADPTWRERVIVWRTERLATPLTVKLQLRTGRTLTRIYPPPAPVTVNREVGFLQQILEAAVDLRYIPASPLYGLKDLPTTTPPRRLTTPDEEARLLPHLELHDRAIWIMGVDTLARFGDILDLRRTDDHGHELFLPDPKNGEPLRVPVSRRLRAALDELPPAASPYYFAVRRTTSTPELWHSAYLSRLRIACRDAKIPYGRAAGGVTFHWGTRRTGATRMIRKGGERVLGIVQRIGGWKNLDVLVRIYQEVTTDEMRDTIEAVSGNGSALAPGNTAETKTPKNGSKRHERRKGAVTASAPHRHRNSR